MRNRILLCIFVGCFIGQAAATDSNKTYTLYLVRHAEKQIISDSDPDLNKAGNLRSHQLAEWFQDKGIKDIWSSDYKRTRDTAKPLVTSLESDLNIYDPDDQAAFVRILTSSGNTALVVGHSNTIPDLARLLCDCSIADMDDTEYERLIVISITDSKIQTKTLHQDDLFQP
jgi:broad specificity phosphatase PhoE